MVFVPFNYFPHFESIGALEPSLELDLLKGFNYLSANVTFHIPAGSASDKFGIFNNGVIYLKDSLDRENTARYQVPVLAKSNKLLDLTSVEIIVVDENDNSPEFRPGSCYTLAIPENEDASVIHTIAAVDIDEGENGEINYSIVGK